mmetsp:Transcript_5281/g.9355  ORF Transcript_5281/g.9355 Transcript_5281/m.9355 type:complete len:120 (+) Transcript_5281:1668-2027(+)
MSASVVVAILDILVVLFLRFCFVLFLRFGFVFQLGACQQKLIVIECILPLCQTRSVPEPYYGAHIFSSHQIHQWPVSVALSPQFCMQWLASWCASGWPTLSAQSIGRSNAYTAVPKSYH